MHIVRFMVRKPISLPKKCTGRPRAPIDWTIVEDMLSNFCTGPEVAAFFGMHPETLYDRCVQELGVSYTDFSYKCRAKTAHRIKAEQVRRALKGSDNLLMFMGKNYLQQRSEPKDENQNTIDHKKVLDSIFEQIGQLQAKEKAKLDQPGTESAS